MPVAASKETLESFAGRAAPADDMARLVDPVRFTLCTAQRSEVHHPVGSCPQERVSVLREAAVADDLPGVVDRVSLANVPSKQYAQVDHPIRLGPQKCARADADTDKAVPDYLTPLVDVFGTAGGAEGT
jgi:hypothetical protein